jgi:iron complex transport system permease protein
MPPKRVSPYTWCIAALLLMLFIGTVTGSVAISPLDIAGIFLSHIPFLHIQPFWKDTSTTILFDIRLPRVFLAALTGAGLSGSGAAYQGLFRNPLADPYLIGVASGAGLGAVIALYYHWPVTWVGMLIIPGAAFIGAIITVLIVYSLAQVGKSAPVTTLILAGVAVSAFATSLTTFLMIQSKNELYRAISWMVGGFAWGGWLPVLVLLPYLAVGLFITILMGRPLNVLQFGEEQASQIGLNVERVKRTVIIAASLVAAASVAFSGLIGFVGLAVPHLVRMLWGSDYRRVIPLSIILGAALLTLADCIARTVIAPSEVPVGIITALAGAPFFLWLLRKSKRQTLW